MAESSESEQLLITRIREGDEDAWRDLIARYEGRLLAFAESRLGNRAAAEDVVQDCFIGFLNSLPNYDGRRSLESYLFSICAYKMTDHLRREGRRPAVTLSSSKGGSSAAWQIPASVKGASSIAISGERRNLEEKAIVESLCQQIEYWQQRGDWVKVKCNELLFVRGMANKDVASQLDVTEQQVANIKFDFLARLRSNVKKLGLDREIFPELYAEE